MSNSVKVFSKAVAVLDALAANGAMSATELAEATAEPRPTIYRLLSALEEHRFVEPGTRRGTFQLGTKLFSLGSAVLERFGGDVRRVALPVMERLREETGETVFLVVRRDYDAVCIERVEGEHVQILILRVGGSLPLDTGAGPRALLAFEPEELWEAFIAQRAGPFPGATPLSKPQLVSELRRIRDEGISISDQDVIAGLTSVAAPILDHTDHVRAAITVSGIAPSMLADMPRIGRLVREAAAAVSQALGYRHDAR